MKITQAQTNPFRYSDTNKRYYTYDYYLKNTFGVKCAKLPIDAGFTCPNIDGRCGRGGCIYCSSRGSGDFAGPPDLSVAEQLSVAAERLASKWSTGKYIAYFQAHTNTYAPLDVLRDKYSEALAYPGIVGLNIATRADCLDNDTVKYLAELSEQTVLTVELGLQTVHDSTAKLINRGHTFEQFVSGYEKLRGAGGKINICIHTILGLPGEDDHMMECTAREVAKLHPDQIKLHLLHVLRDTRLGEMYLSGEYQPLERERYIRLAVRTLELLPDDVVIARLTGDGAPNDLLAPDWSRRKTTVINDIDKMLYARGSMQGMDYKQSQ
ncbi:MAG: TIGR01212 family radical SAM protein [Clostridia bacterium]|nr:TIGR01212 family radical SAM protein [Clostridia bacterium]